jgi:hypothetical protein
VIARLRRTAITTAVLATAVTLLSLQSVSPTEAATSSVRITYVYFDSPGADSGTNTSLNHEYVKIKNFSNSRKTLTGWTVRDKQNHVYRFGTFTLSAGSTVTLYTGKGTNSWSKRFWGQSYYIWNNTGDAASLRSSSGSTLSTCTWTTKGSGYKYC